MLVPEFKGKFPGNVNAIGKPQAAVGGNHKATLSNRGTGGRRRGWGCGGRGSGTGRGLRTGDGCGRCGWICGRVQCRSHRGGMNQDGRGGKVAMTSGGGEIKRSGAVTVISREIQHQARLVADKLGVHVVDDVSLGSGDRPQAKLGKLKVGTARIGENRSVPKDVQWALRRSACIGPRLGIGKAPVHVGQPISAAGVHECHVDPYVEGAKRI
jgi:hypothetical protein